MNVVNLPSRGHAWSIDERATLGQIHDALEGEGVETDCEHGMTDEGDPWTLFFTVSNEEFVAHVARIGLVYLLIWADGTSVRAPNLQRLSIVAVRGVSHALRARSS